MGLSVPQNLQACCRPAIRFLPYKKKPTVSAVSTPSFQLSSISLLSFCLVGFGSFRKTRAGVEETM